MTPQRRHSARRTQRSRRLGRAVGKYRLRARAAGWYSITVTVLRGESNVTVATVTGILVPAIGGYGVEDIYLGEFHLTPPFLELKPGLQLIYC